MNARQEFLQRIEIIREQLKGSEKISRQQKIDLLNHLLVHKFTRKEQHYSDK